VGGNGEEEIGGEEQQRDRLLRRRRRWWSHISIGWMGRIVRQQQLRMLFVFKVVDPPAHARTKGRPEE